LFGPALPAPFQTPQEWIASFLSPHDIENPVYKRAPYRPHKDNLEGLAPIFRALSVPKLPRGCVPVLSKTVNIPPSTLYGWHEKLKVNPEWRPRRDHYAAAQRIFTDAEEYEFVHRLTLKYLDKGLYYSDTDFRGDVLEFHSAVMLRLEALAAKGDRMALLRANACGNFQASSRFIEGFRGRHKMSLRRPSFKRGPKVNEEDVQAFIVRVQELLQTYSPNRILNVDETNWRMVAAGYLTWAKRGSESVSRRLEDDEKSGVTVIAAVDAAGEKLPLTMIGRGKTSRCLARYHLPASVHQIASESGWTTSEVMCDYFGYLRHDLYREGPLVVILDTYSAHRAQDVRAVAQAYEIDLVFIPPGCTDRLQPLDRRVFGVLKSFARQLWRRRYHETEGAKTSRSVIAQNLVDSWERITPEIIDSGWNIDWAWDGGDHGPEKDDRRDETYRPVFRLDDLDEA
jgi:hypothetical protein